MSLPSPYITFMAFKEKNEEIFALVDCNNFYASCERVFNPKIKKLPVVVLSNNDGCAVAIHKSN